MMGWIFEKLYGERLAERTERYVEELRHAPVRASRSHASDLVKTLAKSPGPAIVLGKTPWGEKVSIPVSDVMNSFAMCTGGTGSGKSRFGLQILKSLIAMLPQTQS